MALLAMPIHMADMTITLSNSAQFDATNHRAADGGRLPFFLLKH
jgi:hypothetical protein